MRAWHNVIFSILAGGLWAARSFAYALAGQLVAECAAADLLPTRKIDGTSSSRPVLAGIALRPGDEIRIEGAPDGGETAALDYVEVRPE
jgi:hypothetical protein